MVSPKKYTYNIQINTVMKVELGISAQSNVVYASKCPAYGQSTCGILYRSSV